MGPRVLPRLYIEPSVFLSRSGRCSLRSIRSWHGRRECAAPPPWRRPTASPPSQESLEAEVDSRSKLRDESRRTVPKEWRPIGCGKEHDRDLQRGERQLDPSERVYSN